MSDSSATSRRLVVMTEGKLDRFQAKTGVSFIRYCPQQVACVLDGARAGESLAEIVGTGEGVSIVATVEEALAHSPTGLLIGIVGPGGILPDRWRSIISAFLQRGLDVVSGLHLFISEDDEFAAMAKASGAAIQDLRKPPPDLVVASNQALRHQGVRVLTVGTDCNLGKMVTSLEITVAAREAGWDAEFVATGQTGIAIAGCGIAIDAVVSDFVAGAAERLVLERAERELLVLEGQGSLTHPGFSGVTLGLLHGAAPQALVLCHHPGREHMRACPTPTPVPDIETVLPLYESVSRINFPCKVIAISLNTVDLYDSQAEAIVAETERRCGLPTTDPLRFGVAKIVQALEAFR